MRVGAAVLLLVAAAALSGCTSDGHPSGEGRRPSSAASPVLGGPAPRHQRPPTSRMDALERPVAAQLSHRVARAGLRLDYLDCPHWDGAVPSTMTCRGYVDGLVSRVRVHLLMGAPGSGLRFDARLTSGVLATRGLEESLRRQGWQRADCGDRAAYPASKGLRIVCRVVRADEQRYVVATVRSSAGAVAISDFAGTDDEG